MMKKKYLKAVAAVAVILLCIVAGLSWRGKKTESEEDKEEQQLLTIGFSQVGAESDWRTVNSVSIKDTFTLVKGYNLIFDDARQKQTNQIMAIRSFIQQDVDYIVFSPVVESGWDTVLEEAKRAEIPVIVIDRMVDVKDENLYTAWIGSDFYLEGQKACKTLKAYIDTKEITEVNIVNIQGTLGSTAQLGRTQALEEAVEKYGWNLLEQKSGEFTQARAYEVMKEMLAKYENINFVYCENDNEALGAIDAIREAGKTVGPEGDIQIVSFDATGDGLRSTLEGDIIINIECNPLHGPKAEEVILQLENGESPTKRYYISEQIFVHEAGLPAVKLRGKDFTPQAVTEEIIKGREY